MPKHPNKNDGVDKPVAENGPQSISIDSNSIVEGLREVLPKLLADESVGALLVESSEFHSGPLPSPRTLKQYEEIYPGITKKFAAEWQAETAHRRSLEKAVVTNEQQRVGRAQVFAMVFALAALLTSVVLAFFGAYAAAAIVGSTTVLGVVASFLGQKFFASRNYYEDDADESEGDAEQKVS